MPRLLSPDLIWLKDGTPFSELFGDIYFSCDGLSEIQHVFLDGIDVPNIFQERKHATVVETGFGTGLNFLSLWKLWREKMLPGARLSYVSVEAYPLEGHEMVRAHAPYHSLASLSRELRNNLPPPLAGYHEARLDNGRVRLLLLYGHVREMLAGLGARADAWFLDGFAPANNPAMWTPEVLEMIGQLSKPGARLATFTVAGDVRRGLEAVGFNVQKRSGHGSKRECLTGTMVQKRSVRNNLPWFTLPKPFTERSDTAVIGAGIAGCCLARTLNDDGFNVKIYEAGAELGRGASGTPAAILQPRPFSANDANGCFHAAAFLKAISLYDDLERRGNPVWHSRGLLAVGRDRSDGARYQRFAKSGRLPDGHVEWLDAATASQKIGLDLPIGGAWLPSSGSLNTQALCQGLVDGVVIRTKAEVHNIIRKGDLWQLIDRKGKILGEATTVVLAAGHASEVLSGFGDLGLVANRGQVTFLHPHKDLAGQKASLTYGGYLTPAISLDEGGPVHVMGASFQRIANPGAGKWEEPSVIDNESNIRILSQRLPKLLSNLKEYSIGWVGLRATTSDRYPVVGGIPERNFFEENYTSLHYGVNVRKLPLARYRPDMYVLAGFGSQGFLMAPLVADMLAAVITGMPMPQPRKVMDLMHPARFLIRDLKRGAGQVTMGKGREIKIKGE